MTSPTHIRFHHFPRHPVSRALSVILLLSMPLQGCAYRYVIGPTSPPQSYVKANDLLAGHKVKLKLSDGSTIEGVGSIRMGPDSISFTQGGRRRIVIPAERFSSARYGSRGKGFVLGVAILGGLGAIVGLSMGDDHPPGFFAFSAEDKAVILGILGGVLGGLGGLVIGAPTMVVRDSNR